MKRKLKEAGMGALLEMMLEKSKASEEILDAIERQADAEPDPDAPEESVMLYQAVCAAVTEGIRKSGMSRETVVERVNRLLFRKNSDGSQRQITTVARLNNFLAPSKEDRMPIDLLWALCHLTDDFSAFEVVLSRSGRHCITNYEMIGSLFAEFDTLESKTRKKKAELRAMLRQIPEKQGD